MTFPQYQQAGYGKFIISLSYELTKREGKTGSPEKPLSDLGKVSYRSYWTHVLMHLFANCDPHNTDITMNDMSQQTGIKTEDIISTLQSLDMIKVRLFGITDVFLESNSNVNRRKMLSIIGLERSTRCICATVDH